MTIGRSQVARFRIAVLVAAILISIDAGVGAQVRSERLVERGVPGLHLTAEVPLGPLPPQSMYWHIDEFNSHAAAETARPAHGTVADVFGRHWLYVIADETW